MPRFAISAICLLLICSCMLGQNNALISSGNDKLQKRNYTDALNDFNQVLKTEPENIQALCGSALALNGLGKTQDAMTIVQSAIITNSQSDIAYYTKGEILISSKDYVNAIGLFNKALELNNAHFQSYISKSKAYNLMGNIKDAYKVLDNAIEAFPTSAELLFARGLLNNNNKRYSKSIDDFDKTIRLDAGGKITSVYFNRGIAYTFLEEYESALADLNKAIELDPANANYFYSRGMVNYQLGNFDASVKDFLKSDELYPNNPMNLYNLGMAYYKSENTDKACFYFHKSCGLNNTNACKMIIMVCSDKQQIK